MDSYNTISDLLVNLFNEIMDIEEKAIITKEFQDITNNDMHIIAAIGIDEPRNMTAVAKSMSVTVGTLTIAFNNLVKKGYVSRARSQEDRRVVLISLTEKDAALISSMKISTKKWWRLFWMNWTKTRFRFL